MKPARKKKVCKKFSEDDTLFRISLEGGWRINILSTWILDDRALAPLPTKWAGLGSSWSSLHPDSLTYTYTMLETVKQSPRFLLPLNLQRNGKSISLGEKTLSGRYCCVGSTWTPSVISGLLFHLRYKLINIYSATWGFSIWDFHVAVIRLDMLTQNGMLLKFQWRKSTECKVVVFFFKLNYISFT